MAFSLLRSIRHLSAGLLAATALGATAAPPPLALSEVAGGFNAPVEIAFPPADDTRMFVAQLQGQVRLVLNGVHQATPFLDVSTLISTSSEDGLLGLAFHPNYATNRAFYVFYTRQPDRTLTIARYLRDASNPNIADPASAAIILEIPHPGSPNYGGRLQFGTDGFLYLSTGDGGIGPNGEEDPFRNSQNGGSLLGKMLRISVNGGTGYTIPPSNPNAGMTCAAGRCPETVHSGLRNPWRYSFDRANGDLYIGDVGNHSWEEVNYVPAGSLGRNFGWSIFEGVSCFNDNYFSPSGGACAALAPSHTPPVIVYGHDDTGGYAVLGGHVYHGSRVPGLDGYYIYGDNVSTRVWAARRVGGVWENDVVTFASSPLTYITTFGQDNAGNVYVADYGTGKVFRFDAATPAAPPVKSDFNGNGMADLLFNNTDGRAAIWLMNGTTPTATAEIIGAGSGWSVVQIADFNGDGRADLVWQHTDGRMAIYLMNGTAPTTTTQLLNAASGWSVIHTPDLNGDGRADLVFQNTNGSAAVWLMNGTAMTSGASIIGPGTGWSVTKTADFDGDGKGDLLWTHTDGRVAIWLMDGLTVKSTNQILNAGSGWSVIHTPDLNGDGRADIVWQNTNGSVALWLMNGAAMASGSGLLGAGTGWAVTRVGDFDGDGKGDLFFLHTDGRAAIYLMNGLVPAATQQILNAGGGWSAKRIADLNGDGKADIVFQNTNGSTAVWLMNGTTMTSSAQILGTGTGYTVTAVSQ